MSPFSLVSMDRSQDRAWRATTAPPRERNKRPLLRRRGCRRGLGLAAAMAAEHTGGREFSELMSDHVLGDVKPRKLAAVMHQEGLADEFRNDRAIARPGFERFATAAALLAIHFGQQALIDVRSFFQRTTHGVKTFPLFYLGAYRGPGRRRRIIAVFDGF